ncbi:MAG TPA: imidazoleglycerol-phosphate dehydratase HisB [Firmicutes bacterium]|nr:imidazoleglycerol-phosphate dehydratase HisB [Bacillota bacterium]
MRRATVERATRETQIAVELELDGTGEAQLETGLPFFDHLLSQVARHGLFDLKVTARGDLAVDGHHTVEDTGLALGQAFAQALGEKRGIRRYGEAAAPLDEALARVVLDLSGRPFLALKAEFPQLMVGTFDTALVAEFLRAFTTTGGITLHAEATGANSHHVAEALFKALGRALDAATRVDPRVSGIPSTKGRL